MMGLCIEVLQGFKTWFCVFLWRVVFYFVGGCFPVDYIGLYIDLYRGFSWFYPVPVIYRIF